MAYEQCSTEAAPSDAEVMAGKAARSLGAAPKEKAQRIVRVGEKPAEA
jgi:hypothetical protein